MSILFSVMFFRSIGLGIVRPITSLYIRKLGMTVTELGIIAGGWALGMLIFEPIWGILADRGIKKKLLLLSCITIPLITFSFTLVTGFWDLFFVRFARGAMGVAGAVATMSLTASYPRKGKAFGLWWGISGLASLIGPTIGGYLASIDYVLPFYVSALTSTITIIGALFITEPRIPVTERKEKRLISLNKIEITNLAVACFLIALTFALRAIFDNIVPVYANETPTFLLTELEFGFMFTVISLVAIPSQTLFGELR